MQRDTSTAIGSINSLGSLGGCDEVHPWPCPAERFTICDRRDCSSGLRAGRKRQEVRAPLRCGDACLAREHAQQRNLLRDILEPGLFFCPMYIFVCSICLFVLVPTMFLLSAMPFVWSLMCFFSQICFFVSLTSAFFVQFRFFCPGTRLLLRLSPLHTSPKPQTSLGFGRREREEGREYYPCKPNPSSTLLFSSKPVSAAACCKAAGRSRPAGLPSS